MAQKNWLIRTKNKQILGPATKEKVIELIEKGSLTSEDEITCGNGYWFWVRERDLLEKYLYGDLPQTFNPISEAQDVLTAKTTPDGITASAVESPQTAKAKSAPPQSDANQLPSDDDLAYPDDDDLAYPDMGGGDEPEELDATDPMISEAPAQEAFEDSATGEIEMSEVTQELERPTPEQVKAAPVQSAPSPTPSDDDDENFLYPSAEDLEYPDVPGGEKVLADSDGETGDDDDRTDPNVSIPDSGAELEGVEELEELQELEDLQALHEEDEEEIPQESSAPKKRKLKGKKGKKKRKVVAERKSNDRYLIYIALFIMLAIGVVIYYYKSILNKPLPVIGMQEAHAQTLSSLSKKKTSFL